MAQPWLLGADHVMPALWSPPVAATFVGWSGTPQGMTAADAGDHGPQSARLRARTWNCWGWPLGRLDQRSEVPVVVFVRAGGHELGLVLDDRVAAVAGGTPA